MFLALKSIELTGFKSFGKKASLAFTSPIAAVVGPNGSGKSNVAEAFRFVLGEQSMKSLRSKRGEDLIWGGSPAMARQNRAAVKVTFDNSSGREGKRLLDIDFKEVTIERVVHRDGQNEYLLNGSQVRLKDVIRLLAGANIGGSGYQIISQGEADRILGASPKERREMIEDALGLKLYQHKKVESEKQLAETETNLDKAKSLRRELVPHLHFLRAQVEKLEKAREIKEELSTRLSEYLAREHAYVEQEHALISGDITALRAELTVAEGALADARTHVQSGEHAISPETQKQDAAMRALEDERASARRMREETMRELGRAEAMAELALQKNGEETQVPVLRVRTLLETIEKYIASGRYEDVQREIVAFRATLPERQGANNEHDVLIVSLTEKLSHATAEEDRIEKALSEIREAGESLREAHHEAQRAIVVHDAKRREISTRLASAQGREREIAAARQAFEEEVREGIALLGAGVHAWEKSAIPEGALSEPRSEQEKRRRVIERLKIKIEEAGIANGDDVLREFRHTTERDEFLAREVSDLESSIEKLRHIIAELEETMDSKFTEGLVRINEALHLFFTKLFGGGGAKLTVEKPRIRAARNIEEEDEMPEDEEDELYAGVSIAVSLPRKKVRGLEVLSGGERALTSIALIFAMSQVNPPPFLILDETDAALDEANSRRYADMIRELSARSQLIVITHNRATMSAAGELYGVTMDGDSVSKILSVKFDEALRVAK